MSERPPRAILFDWDNTLVDNWAAIRGGLNEALAAFGLPQWSKEEVLQRVRHSMRDSFPALFGPRWPEAERIFYGSVRRNHLATLRPLPGIESLLPALQCRGIYLGVVSNKTGALLRAEAGHLGWDGYFARLVGAGDAAADKPDPAPVHLALGPDGPKAGPDVWFVGDTGVDMACAINAGCVPILVGRTPLGAEELERWPPRWRLGSCRDILSLAGFQSVSIS